MSQEFLSAQRLKNVSGTVNFRDVGGYKAAGGSVTPGILYRSDALHKIGAAGQADLRGLGVKNVIDLRDDRERAAAPDDLAEETILIARPIFPDALSHVDRKLDIAGLTELIFFEHASNLVLALKDLVRSGTGTVVHCTAGKDRTGAVIALTLSALGVDRDDVLGDYAATEELLRGDWLENHLSMLNRLNLQVTPEVLGLISSSPLPVMEAALKRVEREFGSINDYLLTHGFTETGIEELNNIFIS